MSKAFEYQLTEILYNLTLSSDDRQSYTADADEIRDFIINKMKEKDKEFARCFAGTSLTGSYLDRVKIEQPDEFDININLKLPYPIKIIEDPRYPGYFLLQAVNQWNGSKLTDLFEEDVFYVSSVRLQNWIRHKFNSIFQDNTLTLPPLSSGRSYQVMYKGNTVAHTFTATHKKNRKRKISFDFVPCFQFGSEDWISKKENPAPDLPWFAVPAPRYPKSKINHFIFKLSAPNQERELLKGKNNLKNTLRLIKAIKDHNDMKELASYMIKTVFLWEIENQPYQFWDQRLGILLLHMMQRLFNCVQDEKISFYWNEESNLLDRLSADKKKSFAKKLRYIFLRLENCYSHGYDKNLSKIFGVSPSNMTKNYVRENAQQRYTQHDSAENACVVS